MKDTSRTRLELDRLRVKLTDAWAKDPYPVDEIDQINRDLIYILMEAGLYHEDRRHLLKEIPNSVREAVRAKRNAYYRAYYHRKRSRARAKHKRLSD